jgi:cytochrome P450
VQKTLYQVQRIRKFLQDVDPKSVGASESGGTIMLRLPALKCFILTSDTVLARGVLGGENGFVEGEKIQNDQVINFVDDNNDNILTQKTANPDRASARKAITPALSTSNLTRTWPHVKLVLGEQFAKFRQTAASGGIVDCKSMVKQFFLRTLSLGAFDVEFTDDGTENDGNINGLEYLHTLDVYMQEAARRLLFPLRRRMWWNSDVRRADLGMYICITIIDTIIHHIHTITHTTPIHMIHMTYDTPTSSQQAHG